MIKNLSVNFCIDLEKTSHLGESNHLSARNEGNRGEIYLGDSVVHPAWETGHRKLYRVGIKGSDTRLLDTKDLFQPSPSP